MKKGIIFLVVIFFAFGAKAQQKYGYINSVEIVQAMPEFKQMNDAIDKKKKEAQAKGQRMYAAYQQKTKEMDQYGNSMMQAVREEKLKELDSLQQEINNFQQNATAEIQDFQAKLLKPLNDKYIKIVNSVAKENGYTYIFDLAAGVLVYYPETQGDITALVKKKMGIN
ncbi:MAG TPA: OmpH family outer membrane protein [Chitinophagales bacterium]|nr:OmpH family outer membrane protein [Chitinophagales bacterium]